MFPQHSRKDWAPEVLNPYGDKIIGLALVALWARAYGPFGFRQIDRLYGPFGQLVIFVLMLLLARAWFEHHQATREN